MKWGRRWGKWALERGFPQRTSRWGSEWDDVPPPGTLKIPVRVAGKMIVPCNACRNISKCGLYRNVLKIWRHQEYNQGTNILGECNVYAPLHSPGKIQMNPVHNRTRGKEPT